MNSKLTKEDVANNDQNHALENKVFFHAAAMSSSTFNTGSPAIPQHASIKCLLLELQNGNTVKQKCFLYL
jgi:hypothetical protein